MKKVILFLVVTLKLSFSHAGFQNLTKASWSACQIQGKKCYTLTADTIDMSYLFGSEMLFATNVVFELYDEKHPEKRARMIAPKALWKPKTRQWVLFQGKIEKSKMPVDDYYFNDKEMTLSIGDPNARG